MANEVNFNWDKSFSDSEGTNHPADKLDRAKYAKFLTNFLASEGYNENEEKQNYVLNLNSEWGSGKTYFLRRWINDLKTQYPVVYIDAWKQDYSDDPLMTVISSMIKQLREQAGKSEDDPKFKAPRKLIGLLKAAAPGIARGLTSRYLGIDPVKIMQEVDDEELIEDREGNPIRMGFAASEAVKHLISEHDAKATAIESLKESVAEWIGAVIGHNAELKRNYPAFIFIDELDRCRPSYAVEMLETIKHIFDIPGVVFVVATDTEQLQHAVKVIYGNDFEARTYLGRFFHSRFSLKKPSFETLLQVHCQKEKLSPEYLSEKGITIWPNSNDVQMTLDNITAVLNMFGLSTRTSIQITDRLIAILDNQPKGSVIDIILLTFLMCLREKDESAYEKMIEGKLKNNTNNQILSTYFSSYSHNFKSSLPLTINGYIKDAAFLPTQPKEAGFNVNTFDTDKFSYNVNAYIDDILAKLFNLSQADSLEFTHKLFLNTAETEILVGELSDLANSHPQDEGAVNKILAKLSHHFFFPRDNFKIDHYQDLVELATALDWLEPDDEHG